MLMIDEVRRFPRLGLVGFAVIVVGAVLDVGLNLGADAHGMHGGAGYTHNGHLVALAGMLLVMIAILRQPLTRLVAPRGALAAAFGTDRSAVWLRRAMAATLALAGMAHLVLAPAHFAESTLMGLGFVGSAAAELGLAAGVLARPRRVLYLASIGVASALIALYAYNVALGLPFGETQAPPTAASQSLRTTTDTASQDGGAHHGDNGPATQPAEGHHGGGIQVGQGEPVDASGVVTKLAELVAIGLAVVLLRRRPGDGRPGASRPERPAWSEADALNTRRTG